MNLLYALYAFLQEMGFKSQNLTNRRLQELGASSFGTFSLQRYALIPAIIWAIIFVRPDDIRFIVHTPVLFVYMISIAVIWNINACLASYILNKLSCMSSLSTLQYLIHLPMLLLVGTFFNRDIPNALGIIAIVILSSAFILQPTKHEQNLRNHFSLPLIVIIGLVFLQCGLATMNGAMSRESLSMISPEVFLGVFSVLTLVICNIWTSFLPQKTEDKKVFRKRFWFAIAIPILWFGASIPETYATDKLPIYTATSIGILSFILDTVSDLFYKRIRLNFRTGSFIFLVLLGVGFTLYSM